MKKFAVFTILSIVIVSMLTVSLPVKAEDGFQPPSTPMICEIEGNSVPSPQEPWQNHWWKIDYWADTSGGHLPSQINGRFIAVANTIGNLMAGTRPDEIPPVWYDAVLYLPLNVAYGNSRTDCVWFQFDIQFVSPGSDIIPFDAVEWYIWDIRGPGDDVPEDYHSTELGIPYVVGHEYSFSLTTSGTNTVTFSIVDTTSSASWSISDWTLTVPTLNLLYDQGVFSPASAVEGYTTNDALAFVPYFQTRVGDGVTHHWYGSSGPAPTGIQTDVIKISGDFWYWEMLAPGRLPIPSITSVNYPGNMVVGRPATIDVQATNTGGTATWQTIAVSFPATQPVSDVTVESPDLSSFSIKLAGVTASSAYSTATVVLSTYLIEGTSEWPNGVNHHLRISVTPTIEGDFVFFVKSVSGVVDWASNWTPKEDDSATSEYEIERDQQSEYVRAYSAKVTIDRSPLDVYMLVDLSGSFYDDLPVFKAQAPNMISNLKATNPGARFGLGKFEDYPIHPFGDASSGDKAYQRIIDLTFDTDAVLSCISSLFTRYGEDAPQSQLPALYQAATGAGQDLSGVGFPGASIPPGQQANFRDGATKLFILWTDASFHNPGDPGTIPYPGPSFDETVEVIKSLDPPMVIGISSGSGGVADLRRMATATGALAPAEGVDTNGDGIIDILGGEPLVCAISSSGYGIAEAIEALVEAAVVLPTADANGPYEGEVGTPIILDGSDSFDSDGYITLYEWDFEGDGIFDFSSTECSTSHIYQTAFSGVVTLRVTDNDGNTDTDEAAITIVQTDGIPPETWLVIGDPKFLIGETTYLTSVTSLTLFADDNPGGSGVASINYRIEDDAYDSGWREYGGSFCLFGVSDGTYSIEFYSTDIVGNAETPKAHEVTLDNSAPLIIIENPPAGWALQDGVTFIASASDSSGTYSLNFSIREANGDQGIPVGFENIPATYDAITGRWNWYFNTLQLPDGYYIVLVNAEDNLGHTAAITVPYSIRNWAVLELLPASESNKAGRTMPVKFALRVAASVDPNQPFVYNEDLTIKIYATNNPSKILQTSTYGDTARDYRIGASSEKYHTNFQTLKTPMRYTVSIWRGNFLVGSFTFKTVK